MGWVKRNTSPEFANLASRVEHQESRGDQSAVSPKGAFGVMQLMPDTARDPGFGVRPLDQNAPDAEAENRRLGQDYLNAMLDRYGGDEHAALAAYNWGPGNADKWVAGGKQWNQLPRETQGYIRNIMGGEGPALGAIGAQPQGGRWVKREPVTNIPDQQPDLTIDVEQPKAVEASQVESYAPQIRDLAMSFLSGVESAGIGLAGLPGDIGTIMRNLAGIEGERMTGLTPTSQQVGGAVQDVAGPLYEPQTTAGKYARTVGEFTPSALFPGSAATKIAGVVAPAIGSEAAGQLTEGTSAEPYARVAGAVAGGLAPGALRKAVTPMSIPAERQAAVNTLRQEGVTPTAGQATGSNALRYAESELGGGATARLIDKQGDDFTRAVLRRVGENANRATPEVIDRAFSRIGGQFDRLARQNQIVPQSYPRLQNELARIATEYADVVPPGQQARVIQKTITDLANRMGSGRPISGKVYQSFRSRFDRLARNAKSDPQLSEALYGIRSALDDAMEQSLVALNKTNEIAAWREARTQYRNMMVVERAAAGGGEGAAMGAISPARLRMAASGQNKRQFVRGRSDFTDLANAGNAVLSPMAQSGTAPRAWMRHVPSVVAGGAAGGAYSGDVQGAALGALAGPFIAGRVLMSRPVQGYLGNQIAPAASGVGTLPRAVTNATLARPR